MLTTIAMKNSRRIVSSSFNLQFIRPSTPSEQSAERSRDNWLRRSPRVHSSLTIRHSIGNVTSLHTPPPLSRHSVFTHHRLDLSLFISYNGLFWKILILKVQLCRGNNKFADRTLSDLSKVENLRLNGQRCLTLTSAENCHHVSVINVTINVVITDVPQNKISNKSVTTGTSCMF